MPLPAIAGLVLPLVMEFAPALVRRFAGDKAGNVANKVIETTKQITGHDISTPEGLKEAQELLRKDAELKLKFQQDMAELEVQLEEAYLKDRQDARARDVELRKVGDMNWRANVMLIAAFVAIITIAIVLSVAKGINEAVVGFLIGIGGMFARNIGSAFDFEFGSSRGSKDKDRKIEQLQTSFQATAQSSPLEDFRRRLSR